MRRQQPRARRKEWRVWRILGASWELEFRGIVQARGDLSAVTAAKKRWGMGRYKVQLVPRTAMLNPGVERERDPKRDPIAGDVLSRRTPLQPGHYGGRPSFSRRVLHVFGRGLASARRVSYRSFPPLGVPVMRQCSLASWRQWARTAVVDYVGVMSAGDLAGVERAAEEKAFQAAKRRAASMKAEVERRHYAEGRPDRLAEEALDRLAAEHQRMLEEALGPRIAEEEEELGPPPPPSPPPPPPPPGGQLTMWNPGDESLPGGEEEAFGHGRLATVIRLTKDTFWQALESASETLRVGAELHVVEHNFESMKNAMGTMMALWSYVVERAILAPGDERRALNLLAADAEEALVPMRSSFEDFLDSYTTATTAADLTYGGEGPVYYQANLLGMYAPQGTKAELGFHAPTPAPHPWELQNPW